MTNAPHKHKARLIRSIPEEEVAAFDAAATAADSNRSAITRQLWAWFAGNGELPERPEPETDRLARKQFKREWKETNDSVYRPAGVGTAASRRVAGEVVATDEYEREAAQERRKWAAKKRKS